jgi:MFS family permease
MFGTAVGGFVISLLITRIAWRRTSVLLLCLLIGLDFLSANVDEISTLYLVRFMHGLIGGALIGVGFSVIARIRNPEVTFAVLLFVQLILGGAGIAILMPLISFWSIDVVWYSLSGFSILALVLMTLLDDYNVKVSSVVTEKSAVRAPWLVIGLTLVALFFYQAGEMSIFAYVIEVGLSQMIEPDFINMSVAVSLWAGGPAALMVAWWSTRSGHLKPVVLGIAFTMGSISFLLISESWSFMVANICFGIFFSMTLPYLFGLASEMDDSGQIAAFAGFVSSLGLAVGPAISGLVITDAQFNNVIILALLTLAVSVLLVIYPARVLDVRTKQNKASW